MGEVVLVYSEPFATREDLSRLEKIVKKKQKVKTKGFGYVNLAKTLNSYGVDYFPVLGNNYDGKHKDLVHVISGVDVKTEFSLSDKESVEKIKNNYGWVKSQYGVYGICFGYQIMMVVNGGEICKMNYKKTFTRFQLYQKSKKNNHLGKRNKRKYAVTISHLDCGYYVPEGFKIEAKRDNIIYKIINFEMGHIGVQYHPEMNGKGKKEIAKDIGYLISSKGWK